jgi:hypothetical protein
MVAAKDQQRYEAEIKRQRHGRQAESGVANPQAPRFLRRAHLISGAVVKL